MVDVAELVGLVADAVATSLDDERGELPPLVQADSPANVKSAIATLVRRRAD